MSPGAVSKAAHDIDAHLASVAHSFDLVAYATPINAEEAWAGFQSSHYERVPEFTYLPQALDIGHLKRLLWSVRPESVDDPALADLFHAVQDHLDREITMLSRVGESDFLALSLQHYGGAEPDLVELAERVLERAVVQAATSETVLDADELCELAAAEVRGYREVAPDFGPLPCVSADTFGLLVTHGRLMIGEDVRISSAHADSVIQHEVGTHMLTYYNGRAQPLLLLSEGLPGYEETQEGLSVLAEYLTAGLDADRIRTIALRVIAVLALVEGAEFVDAFRLIVERGLSPESAFSIVTRVYRGGGLTKDAVYLRGLAGILVHVGNGGDLNRLFLGKVATAHVPVLEELLTREILVEPRVLPRYLGRSAARERLTGLKDGMTVLQLIDDEPRTAWR
jgi:uncharacterized protein (TIGR02421 family)